MKISAGILVYRIASGGDVQFLLAHPGGPFWAKKDIGAWTVPKGEIVEGEDTFSAAQREFQEEIGFSPTGSFTALNPVKMKSGKIIEAWAVEGGQDEIKLSSNTFELVWPPKSGKVQTFPEIDRAEWFSASQACQKIVEAQVPFIEQVLKLLGVNIEKLPQAVLPTEKPPQLKLF